MIERENRGSKKIAADWETEDYITYQNHIINRQNLLCELGLIEMICSIISNTEEYDLQYEAILVGIAMLVGGNENV